MKRICTVVLFILFNSAANLHATATIATTDTILADTLSQWITKGTSFDFILIDVRDSSTELSLTGVIATTACRPYNFSYNRGVFDRLIPQLPKQMHIVLYCRTGVRSGICATKLDSAGFSFVYSLRGGFYGWKGPIDSISHVRPLSDLPTPSMVRSSVLSRSVSDRSSGHIRLSEKNGVLMCSTRLSCPHAISVFTMDGQCIEKKQDPFSKQPWCTPFTGPRHGVYVVRLETPSSAYYEKTNVSRCGQRTILR